ncbi:MAG: mercury methylation corrinoid protein HgcA [candidate division FCPU426 bacterium]
MPDTPRDFSIPQPTPLGTKLTWQDYWGAVKVRWNWGRGNYAMQPGLYSVNEPDADSIVLLSSNYKLSLDMLRKHLGRMKAWVLVLDTRGINVWCAAGKGTFGAAEVVRQVKSVQLAQRVRHRRLVAPQLGAPGLSAQEVKTGCDFEVVFGPVRAQDLQAFVEAGFRATPRMRRVEFSLGDRLVLIPVEVLGHLKLLAIVALVFGLVDGLFRNVYSVNHAIAGALTAAFFLALGLFAGSVLTPLLLPWVPGRAFSLKGAVAGLVVFIGFGSIFRTVLVWTPLVAAAWLLLVLATASFTAMNFTGSSTYTSLSGVKKEMSLALPLQALAAVASLVLLILVRFR